MSAARAPFGVAVSTGAGSWLVRWPSGAPRRFRTRAAAQACACRWPVRSGTARVVELGDDVTR
jgi:hypothetical protein